MIAPLYLGWMMVLITGAEAVPGPLVHVAPITAVGKSVAMVVESL